MLDFSVNGALDQTPQCTNSPQPKQLLINGSMQLDRYGPLGFEIMYCIAAALGGEFEQICKVTTADMLPLVIRQSACSKSRCSEMWVQRLPSIGIKTRCDRGCLILAAQGRPWPGPAQIPGLSGAGKCRHNKYTEVHRNLD